ncbi:Cif family virulence factor [Streptomyces cacaoi]|uniref:hypothetical protein n=1 Tax=Streptomyces cacaoi TaxID=1898 RepID=UPI00331D8492
MRVLNRRARRDGSSRARPTPATGRALCAALALVCCAGGCTGRNAERAAVQKVLDRQAAAVRDGDEHAYLATFATGDAGARGERRQVFRNLRRLPLAEWSYRTTAVRRARSGDRATVEATLRYRLAGYDRTTTEDRERFRFVRRGGVWRLAGEASGSAQQLWEQGAMSVRRGRHSLVLGVGRDEAGMRALARVADRAVPAVGRTWPGSWSRRLVLEAPSSVGDMARMLSAPAGSYEGIAAVTTGEEGTGEGADGDGPADRILINPQAYAELSEEGRQVVVTHEATHVATREETTPATPMWLSEGFADLAGNRTSQQRPRELAPELAAAVDEKGDRHPALRSLPTDRDFRFGNDARQLAYAYEGGWLACRLIARDWGAEKLTAFYEAAGRHRGDDGSGGGDSADAGADADDGSATAAALRSVLGVSTGEFTARWRAYVVEELRA